MNEIVQWSTIKEQFQGNLLVGNGGSIALSRNFSYSSLYEHAKRKELLKPEAIEIFDKFQKKYRDFERVLFSLWQADYINGKFKVEKSESEKVRSGYLRIRRSLINAVKDIHPEFGELKSDLVNVGRFITQFDNVFSLNYDLTLYWASLSISFINRNRIEDCFTELVTHGSKQKTKTYAFNDDTDDLREPNGINSKATLLFYPHGNLFIYQTKATKEEKKIGASADLLLSKITDMWRQNDGNPVFICEGSSESKLSSISASKYLTHVFQKELPRHSDSLTIYGWGMGEQDEHIIEQLKAAKYKRVAVSIFTGDKSEKSLSNEIRDIQQKLRGVVPRGKIVFFDSTSSGCWNN